jgi:hypothetical protein
LRDASDIREFCQKALASHGCLIDSPHYDILHVMVPPALAPQFGNTEFLALAFTPEVKRSNPDTQLVTYNSPLLGRVIEIAKERGKATRQNATGLNHEPGNLEEKVQRKITVYNSNLELLSEAAEAITNLVFNFKVSYMTDDKDEEIKTVAVDTRDLRISEKFREELDKVFLEEKCDFPHLPSAPAGPPQKAYEAASNYIVSNITEKVDTYKVLLLKRLLKEKSRINEFYARSQKDAEKRLLRANLTQQEIARMQDRIRAIQLDRKRKVADLTDKYSLRVNIELLSIVSIVQPKIRCDVRISTHGENLLTSLYWDPLLKEVDEVRCDSCGSHRRNFFLTNGILVCTDCSTQRRH